MIISTLLSYDMTIDVVDSNDIKCLPHVYKYLRLEIQFFFG